MAQYWCLKNQRTVEVIGKKVDWWLAIFLLLECWHERHWEAVHGTIHSYSYRLYGWDERLWQHAWVNRIALFLREWAAQINNTQADELLGRLSKAEILMTHDVDAINKTLPIRIKQGAFNLFNVIRHVRRGELIKAKAKMTIALRFYWDRKIGGHSTNCSR